MGGTRSILSRLMVSFVFAGTVMAQAVLSATHEHTSDGGEKTTITFLGPPPVSSLAAVVRGAPYSAEQVSERTRTLADGTKIVEKTPVVQMFRDSAGRRRIDSTQNGVEIVEIRDYVANLEYTLDVENRIAHRMKFLMDPKVRGAEVLPHDRFVPARDSSTVAREPAVRRSLGTRTIEGLLCDGTRERTMIPAGAEGNDKLIGVTLETWISRDLKIRVESASSDPRVGETVTRMYNIQRSDQPPELFQVPRDYQVVEEAGRFSIEVIHPAIPENERPVRGLIQAFADARNAHDGKAAVATYAPEGEFRGGAQPPITGGKLVELWGGVKGRVTRRVKSVQFVNPALAIVMVDSEYAGSPPFGVVKEVYTVGKIHGDWKILVHQQ
jgi:hypothetical protein